MKPIIHIVGLGFGSLDKLSLKAYRSLTGSELVYVCSLKHPAAVSLIEEGTACIELFAGCEDAAQSSDPDLIVRQAAAKITVLPAGRQAALALPGSPLKEGRLVRGLEAVLSDKFQVNLNTLASEGSLEKLLNIMAELRSPWGCPWDQEQTHESLKRYLVEETYEVIEALDTKNMNNLCEELGDLLLQIVFHARIAEENQLFCISDVVREISEKMLRRHPHVFGSVTVNSSQEVLVNWEAIKKAEKPVADQGQKEVCFFQIPKGLPALQWAEEAQKKAAKVGFDWNGYEGPLDKIHEELAELEQEIGDPRRAEDELGDLLFSIVNLSRFLGVNAEESLRQGTRKFQGRFQSMLTLIQEDGLDIGNLSLDEMDLFWNQAKNKEKNGTFGSF